jgi:hypothetical protein
MSTLLDCLRSLPADLVMKDLSAVRHEIGTVAEHITRVPVYGEGYEVRKEPRNYGRHETLAVGPIGGPAIFRELK